MTQSEESFSFCQWWCGCTIALNLSEKLMRGCIKKKNNNNKCDESFRIRDVFLARVKYFVDNCKRSMLCIKYSESIYFFQTGPTFVKKRASFVEVSGFQGPKIPKA